LEQLITTTGPGSAIHEWRDTVSFTGASHWTGGRHTIDPRGESPITLDIWPTIASRGSLVAATLIFTNGMNGSDDDVDFLIDEASNHIGTHVFVLRGPRPMDKIMEIVCEVRQRIRGQILFVGSGKDALDALTCSNHLRDASALVINPLSIRSDLGHLQEGLRSRADYKSGNRDPRVFILQPVPEAPEMLDVAHFLDAFDFTHRGNGLYVNDRFQAFVMSYIDTNDHKSYSELIKYLLRGISDTSRSPRSLYNEIVDQELIPRLFSSLPMDLRDLWDAGKLSTQIGVTKDENETRVNVAVDDKPLGYGALRMFASQINGGLEVARQEIIGGHCSLPGGVGHIEVEFVDGFGNVLGSKGATILEAELPTNAKIFILGSCVSRDAFDLQDSPELVDYRARTSLGSAFAERTDFIENVNLDLNPSAFQRRMVKTDLEKQLGKLLSESAYDFLLLDLIDERLQMIRHANSYVTFSPELQTCGVAPSPSDLVEVGSAEYFDAFTAGLEKLMSVVPAGKIIVNEVYWAENTLEGEPVGVQGQTAKHNRILDRLYRQLRRQSGVHFITYDRSAFVSDPRHKWGPSPFHFGAGLYEQTLQGIARISRGEQ
jgi:hypothetical protein